MDKSKNKRFVFEQKTVVSTSDGDSMLKFDGSCLYLLDEREEVESKDGLSTQFAPNYPSESRSR